MSDTPRTDAAEHRIAGPNAWDPHECGAVHASFARQLERENNDLRKLLEADIAFLRSEGFTTLTELLEDKKRLDWILGGGLVLRGNVVDIGNERAAIDAARKATP